MVHRTVPEVTKLRSLTELSGLRISVETYASPKGPVQCKRCQRLGHTQRNCGYTPRCVACGEAHKSGGWSTPKKQLKCCGCGENHTANYRGCAKWKGVKAALARRAPIKASHSGAAASPSAVAKAAHPVRGTAEPWWRLEPCRQGGVLLTPQRGATSILVAPQCCLYSLIT
jgi:hypothetical protein